MNNTPINWRQYGHPENDTGYPATVLNYIWDKYGNKEPLTDPFDLYKYFFFFFELQVIMQDV